MIYLTTLFAGKLSHPNRLLHGIAALGTLVGIIAIGFFALSMVFEPKLNAIEELSHRADNTEKLAAALSKEQSLLAQNLQHVDLGTGPGGRFTTTASALEGLSKTADEFATALTQLGLSDVSVSEPATQALSPSLSKHMVTLSGNADSEAAASLFTAPFYKDGAIEGLVLKRPAMETNAVTMVLSINLQQLSIADNAIDGDSNE